MLLFQSSEGVKCRRKKKGKGVISWLHPAETKDIPASGVSSSEHHLAGMLSKPLNYQQMSSVLEKMLKPIFWLLGRHSKYVMLTWIEWGKCQYVSFLFFCFFKEKGSINNEKWPHIHKQFIQILVINNPFLWIASPKWKHSVCKIICRF